MNSQPRRRFLRFRLRTMLLLPLVVALGWWWITWPERTANQFAELLSRHDVAGARAMSDLPEPSDFFWALAKSDRDFIDRPISSKRSWSDRLLGRQSFIIPLKGAGTMRDSRTFVARVGRVSLSPANGGNLSINYLLRRYPAGSATDTFAALTGFALGPNSHFVSDSNINSVVVNLPDAQQVLICELLKAFGEEVPDLPVPPRLGAAMENRSAAPSPPDPPSQFRLVPPHQRSEPGEKLPIKIPKAPPTR